MAISQAVSYGIKDVLRSFKAIYKEIRGLKNEFLNNAQTATVFMAVMNQQNFIFNLKKCPETKDEFKDFQALLSEFNDFRGLMFCLQILGHLRTFKF